MYKNLLLMLMAAGQLVAMEPADSSKSDTTTCNFKVNKNVRIMLANRRTIAWPAESHQVTPFERSMAQKIYEDGQQSLNTLFEQATTVLRGDNVDDQVAFFDVVIKKLTISEHLQHPMGYMVSRGRLEGVLLSLALYCQLQNQGNGTQGIWDKVLATKQYIDARSFQDISQKDKRLMCCMYRRLSLHENCPKKVACRNCIGHVSDHIAENVVDSCCADKVNLGHACDKCAKRIKCDLYGKVKKLVYGLYHFGVATQKAEHKALIEWVNAK